MIALILIALAPVQDAQRWGEALATYQRNANGKTGLDRAKAVSALADGVSEKYERQCWQLAYGMLRQEVAREGPGGKTEEKVSGDVLHACLKAFKRLSHKDVVAEMLKVARAKGESPRARSWVVWGLAKTAPLKDLLELVDDKMLVVQVAAMDALVEREDKGAAPLFLKLAGADRTWEVKLLALRGLETTGDEACVDPLLELLGKCRSDEGRLKDQFLKTLGTLTGLELASDDPNAWRAAWTAKKAGAPPPEGATVVEPTEFYGLRTRSTRLVFVLDRTGSMMAPGSEPPRGLFKVPTDAMGAGKEPPQETAARDECTRILQKWQAKKVQTRMDAAKKELILTVYALSPRVHFNVVWYEAVPKPWKPELLPATWMVKLDCLRETDKLDASGPTNMWDALEMAFQMLESMQKRDVLALDRKANYATSLGGADTFFLMTDGQSNTGRIADNLEILAELRKVNHLRKVTIHTICVGDLLPGQPPEAAPDPLFLRRLAEENGGEFTHIKQ